MSHRSSSARHRTTQAAAGPARLSESLSDSPADPPRVTSRLTLQVDSDDDHSDRAGNGSGLAHSGLAHDAGSANGGKARVKRNGRGKRADRAADRSMTHDGMTHDGMTHDGMTHDRHPERARDSDGRHSASSPDSPTGSGALSTSVLVLNRFYLAVHVVNVRRAFTLLYRELAEVLDVEDGQYFNYDFASWIEMSELRRETKNPIDDWIRSVSFEIQVPRVIRLLRYDRVPRYTMRFNRRNLFARDGHRCQYCGVTPPSPQLSLDHVLPRSRGGGNSWENVVCCCVRCNTRKGGRTPQEARMQLLRPPRKPAQSPMLTSKLRNPKYETWKVFIATTSRDDPGHS